MNGSMCACVYFFLRLMHCQSINFILTRTFQTIKKNRCYRRRKSLDIGEHWTRTSCVGWMCAHSAQAHTVVAFVKVVVTQKICHLALYHKSWCTTGRPLRKVGSFIRFSSVPIIIFLLVFWTISLLLLFSLFASGGNG